MAILDLTAEHGYISTVADRYICRTFVVLCREVRTVL